MSRFLLPLAVAQGIWVRRTAEVLPVASGPTTGAVGDGSPLRLGIVGESSAAGCGVDTHEEGFPGCLAREVAARTGRRVRWEVAGEHAATARHIRDSLLPRLETDLDVAVLLAGVNDVLWLHAPGRWERDLDAILDDLGRRAKRVAVIGIPAFDAFPSLPKALGRYLTWRASILDRVSRAVCAARPRTTWISTTAILPVRPDFFARDGFHPSATGYRRWARAVAEQLS
ncbi:MAG TPA: SGNH/GDSL hydrolase family protein [Candidatus Limnocylindrales bacterium]|nr:SGNH/GDSL hydrolase family protein [Candidatus Limnocylindrales bacterium]